MKNTIYRAVLTAFILSTILYSCKKGDTGPAGPPNNANVVSKTFPASGIIWTAETQFGIKYQIAQLAMPEIDANIINNGAVLVYGALRTGQPWTALPLSYVISPSSGYLLYGIQAGAVVLRLSRSDNIDPGAADIAFRVVVIKSAPGERLGMNTINKQQFNGYSVEELQHKSYAEISRIFNITAH
ncbi:hypothetical protein HHL16_16765 [Pseudoflavitalea sp. G-6-1-2]|uniref:hypothetical protein n=1 Tax=Pseudoflavitalea sp. G-6-1-2 TaxID=2728841 RepID=UPI00146E57DD|nr:hypothetical protein [Pseudoflavitalea sp. G-6-1-2]NML22536.1 hypothetical protein [Pseudoflavitalea sp. G-6-1-2]